ncbi:MAG: hypothetical protein FGM33_08950 [Candidatus Kapabacteria bacterium]|nr:hypothetical protein [Candidatus Kapabacteria bacterium]
MSLRLSTILGLLAVVSSTFRLFAQAETSGPNVPSPLPTQIVPSVPQRVFQVYGGISGMYQDSAANIQRRFRTVTTATAIDEKTGAPNGDSIYMFSSLGLLVLDRIKTQTDKFPQATMDSSGRLITLERRLGFWVGLDVVTSVPDPDGDPPDVATGPSVLAWPNPFRESVRLRVVRGLFEDVEAYVSTLDGRALGRLPLVTADEDGFEFVWDGRDQGGNDVANGTYTLRFLARVSASSRRIGFSATIVRSR